MAALQPAPARVTAGAGALRLSACWRGTFLGASGSTFQNFTNIVDLCNLAMAYIAPAREVVLARRFDYIRSQDPRARLRALEALADLSPSEFSGMSLAHRRNILQCLSHGLANPSTANYSTATSIRSAALNVLAVLPAAALQPHVDIIARSLKDPAASVRAACVQGIAWKLPLKVLVFICPRSRPT